MAFLQQLGQRRRQQQSLGQRNMSSLMSGPRTFGQPAPTGSSGYRPVGGNQPFAPLPSTYELPAAVAHQQAQNTTARFAVGTNYTQPAPPVFGQTPPQPTAAPPQFGTTDAVAMQNRAQQFGAVPPGGAGYVSEGPAYGAPRSPELASRIAAMRQQAQSAPGGVPFGRASDLVASREGTYNRPPGAQLLGGSGLTGGVSDARMERFGQLRERNQQMVENRAARRGGSPFTEAVMAGQQGGGQGEVLSQRDQLRQQAIMASLPLTDANSLADYQVAAQTDAEALFNQFVNGDITSDEAMAAASTLRDERYPTGVDPADLLDRLIKRRDLKLQREEDYVQSTPSPGREFVPFALY